MSATFFDLMKYAATGIAVPSMTHFDKMRALSMAGGSSVQSITGIPPISFTGNGKPLVSWSMLGNGSQTGTPTPDAPIMPDFVGTLSGDDWTIPITCAGQTMSVYLGEVQTVRKIGKLVLTGNENWYMNIEGDNQIYNFRNTIIPNKSTLICNAFENVSWNDMRIRNESICAAYTFAQRTINIRYDEIQNLTDFKAYLADQYAAGTPVTVWYVLETPETDIVNEPLAKIGDYADELHSTIPIPTVKGQNLLTVDTTLPPSEMTITGYIK